MPGDNLGRIARAVHGFGALISTILGWNFGTRGPAARHHRFFCCFSGAGCGVYCSYLLLLFPMGVWATVQSLWPSLIYFLTLVVSDSPTKLLLIFFVIIPGLFSIVFGLLFGWLVALTSPEEATVLTLFLQSLILVIVLTLLFLLLLLAMASTLAALLGARSAFGKLMRSL